MHRPQGGCWGAALVALVLTVTATASHGNNDHNRREDLSTFMTHDHHLHGHASRPNHNNNAHNNNAHNNNAHNSAHHHHNNNSNDNGSKGNGNSNSIVPASRCRHNYHERTEQAVNRQINLFLHAAYVYSSMSQHFGRCDVALPGFSKYFRQLSTEQRDKSDTLLTYQNLRGGAAVLSPVAAPGTMDWGSGLEAMRHALDMEKSINQVDKIFTLSQYISNLERVGPGLGEYLFDKLPQA